MKKILVIDYDQGSLAALQALLTKQGYEVITASDGQAGWDKYNKECPDLILMEAMLPKVHGFELCQRITSERNSQATVFIMTGVYKDRVYRTEALRTYGASEYFEKPLKIPELLAAVEAVLGKPVPRPAAEPDPVRPVREVRAEPARPEPMSAGAQKREKPKSDDVAFSLPADLDQLSRGVPKIRKPVPSPRATQPEARFESLADELLKQVVSESASAKAKVEARQDGGNGNGRESADIDSFLKSALGDLELTKEKVKVPKTGPLPPPPVKEKPLPPPPPPIELKPKPTPPPPPPHVEKPVVMKPMPTPSHFPDPMFSIPDKPVAKNTLTPGDPGSDTSPFFTPEKPKPETPPERPKVPAASVPPQTHVSSPKPPQPAERAEKKAAPAPAPRPQPEPVRSEPVKPEPHRAEAEAIASSDLFQDLGAGPQRKGVSPVVAIVVGVAALAVLGYVFLRPKKAAPIDESLNAPESVTQAVVQAPQEEVMPPPPSEPKPVERKVEPKPKPKRVDPGPTAVEGIMPQVGPSGAPPLTPGNDNNASQGAISNPAQAAPPPAKTEEAAPPATNPPETAQGSAAKVETAVDPGTAPAASAPATAEPTVKEGDLVELNAITEPPKIIKQVRPVYPPTAQQLGIEGLITVNALIDEKGNVIDTGILKGIKDDKGLGQAAENAVKKWKFQPARKNGVAVKVWKPIVIAFKSGKEETNTE